MYQEEDYIQTAPEGESFGHHRAYKYRVMDRQHIGATHHTNDLEDARRWFNKQRDYWNKQDQLAVET